MCIALIYTTLKEIENIIPKETISMSMEAAQAALKPWRWMRLNLIFTMCGIYINSDQNPRTKFGSSYRSTKFKDILPWNITQMIPKTTAVSKRIAVSCAMTTILTVITVHPPLEFEVKSMDTDIIGWLQCSK